MTDVEETANSRPALTKLTVNLTPKSVKALDAASGIEELSKTDTVNRALQLYGYLSTHLAAGYEILLRDRSGTIDRLHIS